MSKELNLINLLTVRTINGKTSWEPTAKEREFLTVVADEIAVLICEFPSRDPDEDSGDYVMTVKDKDDREIFSIRNALDDVEYKDLVALYIVARRSALNIDKTLDMLLKNLSEE